MPTDTLDFVVFNTYELSTKMRQWTDSSHYVIAPSFNAHLFFENVSYIGTVESLIEWVKRFPYSVGTIWVATEMPTIDTMRTFRPDLDIRQVPLDN